MAKKKNEWTIPTLVKQELKLRKGSKWNEKGPLGSIVVQHKSLKAFTPVKFGKI